MLPQHGGTPKFNMRIPTPILLLMALILFTGTMISLSLFLRSDPGDISAHSMGKLTVIITLLLSFFLLVIGTGRWWHPHLWKSRRKHHHHRHHHHHHHHHSSLHHAK